MLWSECAEWSKWTRWERMSRISNVVIRVSRMIIVDKVGKSWYIFKCCDQSWCMMCCAVMQNFWESFVTLVQTKISRFCVLAKIELFRDRCALEMGGLPLYLRLLSKKQKWSFLIHLAVFVNIWLNCIQNNYKTSSQSQRNCWRCWHVILPVCWKCQNLPAFWNTHGQLEDENRPWSLRNSISCSFWEQQWF